MSATPNLIDDICYHIVSVADLALRKQLLLIRPFHKHVLRFYYAEAGVHIHLLKSTEDKKKDTLANYFTLLANVPPLPRTYIVTFHIHYHAHQREKTTVLRFRC